MARKWKVTGWITPNKEFVECKVYNHITLQSLQDPRLSVVTEIAERLDELDAIHESCQDLSEREGHCNAEWHWYDMACDDLRSDARSILLKNGFIRVGSSEDAIHFEANSDVIYKHHQFLKDFAEGYGVNAVFCPQKIMGD